MADPLEASSFIQALRRFICRRGPIREIRCNRGTNFICAEAELKRAVEKMDDQKIKAELLKVNINWVKNPASASTSAAFGKIRSIRGIVNSLIREHCNRLDEESLKTFLKQKSTQSTVDFG